MRTLLKASVAAMMMAGIVAGMAAPASARDNFSISIDPGGIAFGYSDGYWDRDHHWHNWANRNDLAWYREHNREHYFAHRHDRDREGGWRNEWWR